MIETEAFIWFIFGTIVAGIGMLIYSFDKRLSKLEETFYDFPTPEEFAKEVMKVKLPISQIPPELAEQLRQMANTQNGIPDNMPIPDKIEKDKKMSYVG